MKIVCVSDTHGKEFECPEGDVLIHAGDFCYEGSQEEAQEFCDWLAMQPHKHKVVVPGNHDFFCQEEPDKFFGMLREKNPDVHYLVDEVCSIEGLTIYGSPWIPTLKMWAFYLRDDLRAQRWALIPDNTDILVTHGPAYMLKDLCINGDKAGCHSLRQRVSEVKPKHHVFGHIHEDYGSCRFGYTRCHNVSVCNVKYDPVNKPTVIEM